MGNRIELPQMPAGSEQEQLQKMYSYLYRMAEALNNNLAEIGNGNYTDEEMKMQNEGRRILHLPELRVSCTCVRVPVLRSHSISINLWTKEKISVSEAADAISKFPGCRYITDPLRDYPTPLDAAGQDTILVGRLREDLTRENGLALWCCGDQLRKGAAANALQILQYLER